jgi:hypothetical protein
VLLYCSQFCVTRYVSRCFKTPKKRIILRGMVQRVSCRSRNNNNMSLSNLAETVTPLHRKQEVSISNPET